MYRTSTHTKYICLLSVKTLIHHTCTVIALKLISGKQNFCQESALSQGKKKGDELFQVFTISGWQFNLTLISTDTSSTTVTYMYMHTSYFECFFITPLHMFLGDVQMLIP